jgi:citrate synthase
VEEVAELLGRAGQETDGMSSEDARRDWVRTLIGDARSSGRRIPGFGAPLDRAADIRPPRLLELQLELGLRREHAELLELIRAELENAVAAPLAANVNGVVAAILLDLGFPWRSSRAFAIVARTVGLTAHVLEEIDSGRRGLAPGRTLYEGPT